MIDKKINSDHINSKHKNGTISELIAQAYFINNDFIVSKPINHFGSYDFLADKKGQIYRIQVKTIYREGREGKGYRCNLKKSRLKKGGREITPYTTDEIDYICAVEPNQYVVYLIPFDLIKHKTAIYLHPFGKIITSRIDSVDYEIYKNYSF